MVDEGQRVERIDRLETSDRSGAEQERSSRVLVAVVAVFFGVMLAAAGVSSSSTALLALLGLVGVIGLGAIVRFAPQRACDSLLLLFVGLVAIPIDVYPGYREHTGGWPGLRISVADVSLYLLVGLALAGAFLERIDNAIPRRVFMWMGLVLIQYMLSALFAVDPMLSLFEIASTVHAFLIAIIVADLFRRDLLGWILTLIALQVIVHTTFAAAQTFTGRPIGAGWLGGNTQLMTEVLEGGAARFRPAGLFAHPIVYAMSLVITLPLLTAGLVITRSFLLRALQGVALAIGGVGLVFTLSRGAWLSSLVAAAVMGFLTLRHGLLNARQIRQIVLAGLAMTLVLGIAFGPRIYERLTRSDSGNLTVRFDLNSIAFRMTLDNPVFGSGLNNFVETADAYDPAGVMGYFPAPVHNLYLLESGEAGIPALVFWIGLFLSILLTGLRGLYHLQDGAAQWIGIAVLAGILGFLVAQLADFSHRLEPLRSMLWLNVGLLFGMLHSSRKSLLGRRSEPAS